MKSFTTLFIILMVAVSGIAQTNLMKYWYYRNRLLYFVVPGEKQGESEVAGFRNREVSDSLDYGQHGGYFGYYLGVLATEYYLLLQNSQITDAYNTNNELLMALNQFRNFMDINNYWGNADNENTIENGFFVRENMPCDFLDSNASDGITSDGQYHIDLMNKGLTPANDWDPVNLTFRGLPRGHPGYCNHIKARLCNPRGCEVDGVMYPPSQTKEPMSTDEAIAVLLGLSLVKKLGSLEARDIATEIACRIIFYVQYNNLNWWTIRLPNGGEIMSDMCNSPGSGNALAYAYPFVIAAKYFDNNCVMWDGQSSSDLSYAAWQLQSAFENSTITNNTMAATLAAISDSWVIGLNFTVGVCPLCIHFTISANNTPTGIQTVTGNQNNETFYLALWEVLHNKSTDKLSLSKLTGQLDNAPCEGPYKYDEINNWAGGGWATTYRWRSDISEQYGGAWPIGNFNGLDYMLMYNLYHILDNTVNPFYTNYDSRVLTGYNPFKLHNIISGTSSFPLRYIAFNSIESTQTIGLQTQPIVTNDPGDITYIAESSIRLKPGFHAMNGSKFHALIRDVDCTVVPGASKEFFSPEYPEKMYTAVYDSLISVTRKPYPLTHENALPPVIHLPCPLDTLYFDEIQGDAFSELFEYYWDFGNGKVSTDKNPKVFYQPGRFNFILTLTDADKKIKTLKAIIEVPDCANNNVNKEYFSNTESVDNAGNLNYNTETDHNTTYNLVPNPSKGVLTIHASAEIDIGVSLLVSDITGRKVYEYVNAMPVADIVIDLSGLKSGIYLCGLFSKQGAVLYNDKIIICR